MIVEEEDSIEIEKIESHRILVGKLEYRIKFKGYGMLEWIPGSYFQCNKCEYLEKYNKEHNILFDGDNSKIIPKLKTEAIVGNIPPIHSNKQSIDINNESSHIPLKRIKMEENVRVLAPQSSSKSNAKLSHSKTLNKVLNSSIKESKSEGNVQISVPNSSAKTSLKRSHSKIKTFRSSIKENTTIGNAHVPTPESCSRPITKSFSSKIKTISNSRKENKRDEYVRILCPPPNSTCTTRIVLGKSKPMGIVKENPGTLNSKSVSTPSLHSKSGSKTHTSNNISRSASVKEKRFERKLSVSNPCDLRSNTDVSSILNKAWRIPLKKNRMEQKSPESLNKLNKDQPSTFNHQSSNISSQDREKDRSRTSESSKTSSVPLKEISCEEPSVISQPKSSESHVEISDKKSKDFQKNNEDYEKVQVSTSKSSSLTNVKVSTMKDDSLPNSKKVKRNVENVHQETLKSNLTLADSAKDTSMLPRPINHRKCKEKDKVVNNKCSSTTNTEEEIDKLNVLRSQRKESFTEIDCISITDSSITSSKESTSKNEIRKEKSENIKLLNSKSSSKPNSKESMSTKENNSNSTDERRKEKDCNNKSLRLKVIDDSTKDQTMKKKVRKPSSKSESETTTIHSKKISICISDSDDDEKKPVIISSSPSITSVASSALKMKLFFNSKKSQKSDNIQKESSKSDSNIQKECAKSNNNVTANDNDSLPNPMKKNKPENIHSNIEMPISNSDLSNSNKAQKLNEHRHQKASKPNVEVSALDSKSFLAALQYNGSTTHTDVVNSKTNSKIPATKTDTLSSSIKHMNSEESNRSNSSKLNIEVPAKTNPSLLNSTKDRKSDDNLHKKPSKSISNVIIENRSKGATSTLRTNNKSDENDEVIISNLLSKSDKESSSSKIGLSAAQTKVIIEDSSLSIERSSQPNNEVFKSKSQTLSISKNKNKSEENCPTVTEQRTKPVEKVLSTKDHPTVIKGNTPKLLSQLSSSSITEEYCTRSKTLSEPDIDGNPEIQESPLSLKSEMELSMSKCKTLSIRLNDIGNGKCVLKSDTHRERGKRIGITDDRTLPVPLKGKKSNISKNVAAAQMPYKSISSYGDIQTLPSTITKDVAVEETISFLSTQSDFPVSLSPKYMGPNFTDSSIDSSLYSAESLSGYTTEGDVNNKDIVIKGSFLAQLSPSESIATNSTFNGGQPLISILRDSSLSPPKKRVKLHMISNLNVSNIITDPKDVETPMNIDILLPIIATNNERVFDHVLRIYDRSVLCQIVKDNPCLLVLAAINDSLIMVNTLLGLGGNVNGTDYAGTTALIAACNNGNETMLDLLIRRGADVNIMSNGKNKLLEKCITSNNVRLFERVLSAKADYSSIEHLIVDKTSEMAIILDEHKKRILEPLNIRIRSSNHQFYKNIVSRLSANNGVKIFYRDQTQIPFSLKINRLARKMILFSCGSPKSYSLEQIIEGPLLQSFEIHVAQNEGQLVAVYKGKRLVTALNTGYTYYVNKDEACMWRFSLRPQNDPSKYAFICALELYNTGAADETKTATEGPKKDYGYLYNPIEEDFSVRRSFIRLPLSNEEIRARLVFIDVEWRETVRYTLTPVKITALNYDNTVLLSTFVCPRDRLRKSTGPGANELDMLGSLDEFKAKDMIQEMVRGKILVSHSTKKILNHLSIDKDSLCGIRDLSSGLAVRRLLQDSNDEYMDLGKIAQKLSIEEDSTGSSVVASLMLKIYRALEKEWEDDIMVSVEIVKSSKGLGDSDDNDLRDLDGQCLLSVVDLPDLNGDLILAAGEDLPDLGGQCLQLAVDTSVSDNDDSLLRTTAEPDYDILDMLDIL